MRERINPRLWLCAGPGSHLPTAKRELGVGKSLQEPGYEVDWGTGPALFVS